MHLIANPRLRLYLPNNSCYHFKLGEKDERGSVFFSWDDRLSVALLVSDSDEMSVWCLVKCKIKLEDVRGDL